MTVSWSVMGPGSISASGLYTAPAVLTTPDTATVIATPTADPTKAASTSVTIPQVTLAVSPGAAILNARNAQSFAAVVGNATDTSVNWSVTGGGTIDGSGTYTAPSTVATTSTVTVTAISVADPGKAATATVTLSPFTADVSGYVITSDFQYQTLTVDAIDSATGKLRPNGQKFISSDPSAAPYRTIVHPSGKFVYADWIFTGIQGYSISADGSLTLIPGSPFAVPNSRPSAMTITPEAPTIQSPLTRSTRRAAFSSPPGRPCPRAARIRRPWRPIFSESTCSSSTRTATIFPHLRSTQQPAR
jgi:hypothetical protein